MKRTTEEVIESINSLLEKINKEKGCNLEFVRFKFSFVDKKSLLKTKNPIILRCYIHGEFECSYRTLDTTSILCPICRAEAERKTNGENFLRKAKELFGDLYIYDKVKYIDASTKVCIICPIHGEFWQTPNSHLNKNGCPICGSKTKYYDKEKTLDLIRRECSLRIKNGVVQTFVRCLDDWKFGATKIIINCPIHGDYIVSVKDFLENRSFGCQKCSINNHSLDSQREEQFKSLIEDCNIIFGKDHYDFSKSIYVNENTKIEVICKEHGSFFYKTKIIKKRIWVSYMFSQKYINR